ncbi:hypothetical protein VaNZ11_008695, partial [Volvox africanus]
MAHLRGVAAVWSELTRRVDALGRDHERMDARFRDQRIPWDANLLPRLKRSALHLLAVHLRVILAEAEASTGVEKGACNTTGTAVAATKEGTQVVAAEAQRGRRWSGGSGTDPDSGLTKLLDGGVAFAFRVHQMVGGFDAECIGLLESLGPLWRAMAVRRSAKE